jgi:AraC-like DNA-binding protein/mannose-6-phosphate isomerase-like protein (cupin superfamily)
MDDIDMKKINDQETRYYRIPEKIVQKHLKNKLLKDMMVVSCGYRSGKHPTIGYDVHKNPCEEYFLKYCTEGEGWYEVDGTRYRVRPGDLIICKNWQAHKYGAMDKNPWTVSWVYFIGNHGTDYMDLLQGEKTHQVIHLGLNAKIESYFYEMLKKVEKGYALQYHIHSANVLKSLLSYIHMKSETKLLNKMNRFEDVLIYMKQNLYMNISLDDMAHHFSLSKDHFTKLFKKQYGFTPVDYFIHMKMQRACKLLTTTQEPIKAIAQELGYQDYYYFSRLFKNKIGISPKMYKERFN